MKIIQTKHLKNSVARKQVCVPSKLQMRRNHFIGSHLEFSPPYSHPVIWLSPAPHLTLNWTETWPLWLCPPQGSHPLRPTLLSAPHGLLGLFHLPPQLPHLPVHTHLSFSGSAGWLHRQVPLASQTRCVYNPASEPFLPREALFPVMPSPGRQPCCHAWWFLLWDVPESSPLSFPLSCLVSAVRVVGNVGFGDRTEFESQVVLPLYDCVPFHKLLQISESQFPLKSDDNSTCHTGLLWGLKWKLIY